jgi:hypothetical protein
LQDMGELVREQAAARDGQGLEFARAKGDVSA